MYHQGSRKLQERFGSVALANRLLEKSYGAQLSDADKIFVEAQGFFFLATADADGRPDCSFKGGPVKVVAPDLLVFPDFDGNGMFKSLGNISVNPHVGLLFIAMTAKPKRLRVNGRAEIVFEGDPLIEAFAGAQAIVRVTPDHVFPNCPRYIPDLPNGVASRFLPKPDAPPEEPAWKAGDTYKDVVPPRRR